MKKIHLSFLLIILNFFFINAQEKDNIKNTQFGFKGGINISTISGLPSNNFYTLKTYNGFYGGFLLQIDLNNYFSIQPEIYYSQQGFELRNNDSSRIIYRVDYLQLPVLLKAYIIGGLNVQLGPQLGLKLSEEINGTKQSIFSEKDKYFEKTDIGFIFGLEYNFDKTFLLNVRYIPSITEIQEGTEIRNSVFQIGVGFLF
ncbi:porin family protein [Mesonia aquimarina]|uniref:porin family protein n=1 Tax=Mesonia aquimarina TaxID=1504967 RepID=UPI000EF5D9C3|nr:porin family protein [Mesonia aquimarina]